MFTLSTFRAPCCNPIIVQHLFTLSCFCFHKTQNYFRCFCFQKQLQLPLQSMAPSVVAEYAKSNRSACKKCSEKIAAQALRLGSVSRDSRGFDLTKWHHVDCFPFASEPIDSADSIKGFSSLKSGDQEALKKLVVECKKSPEEVSGRSQNENAKVQKTNEDKEEVELEEGNSKRIKVVNTLSLGMWIWRS
ncbi:polynucleotide 3'-phosphatase ZDP-like [Pistacia vera]|uniref:polynucleotide 3'-phosphatase ZDP-like n=1 Tax=Pistacia vera TaxID=55513 RepID=UPI001262D5FB|nr:polynucleotide 3'-phosphatase ZDP-like [Pistacia vera]